MYLNRAERMSSIFYEKSIHKLKNLKLLKFSNSWELLKADSPGFANLFGKFEKCIPPPILGQGDQKQRTC
jgi:hypothetical protein